MALKVGNATPSRITSVGNAKPPKKPLKVVYNNGGMQGSNYNPQSTYNPQRTAPARRVQSTYNPQQAAHAARVQQAATQTKIRAAAEAKRRAVQKEIARQKELVRRKIQGQVDTKIIANRGMLNLRVSRLPTIGGLSVAQYRPGKIKAANYERSDPEEEYDRLKKIAYNRALAQVNTQSANNLVGKLGDFFTGGALTEQKRREYAEKFATEFADKNIAAYQQRLSQHEAMHAKLNADFKAKQATLTPQQQKQLADRYNQQLAQSVKQLRTYEAYITGSVEAFDKKASAPLRSAGGRVASFVNRNIVQKAASNPLWKYTLGEGDKNIPSLVTAPSRIVNTVGNLNTKDRQINKYGGGTTSRVGSSDNAWQASFNQRNFNIKPVQDRPYDKNTAWAEVKAKGGISAIDFERAKTDEEREKIARKYWDNQNKAARNMNSIQELAADPLNLAAGAVAALKSGKYLSKLDDVARAGKYTSGVMRTVDRLAAIKTNVANKVTQSKVIKVLGAEAKTAEEHLAETIKTVSANQADFQKKVLPKLKDIDKKLTGGKTDFSVFDDIAELSEREAKILQRTVDGKLSPRDSLVLIGKNNAPIRAKMEAIAQKWQTFSEQMKVADNVQNTRFGQGKKFYSPKTAWVRQSDKGGEYNFRLRKKGKNVQSKSDLETGIVDRYIASKYGKNKKGLSAERNKIAAEYEDFMGSSRAEVEAAYKKTQTPLNKARKVISTPTRLWKKSVLKYRPAWTVNNAIYNTQASVLSGGSGALLEQAKMLRPKYYRQAMKESRATFGSNLGKEIGNKGRLSRFYEAVEDVPRVAAGRSAMKKGLTEQQALKRVNNYLYDYTTKNWERPIKSVIPFWSFQKNLAKASVKMPFDRPLGAQAYNRVDRYQKQDFDKQFAEVIPELKKQGYSDQEIEEIKAKQAKYFAGRLRIGDKYYTTPFNAFSEKGLTSAGVNPFLAATAENADSVDQWGRPVAGKEASWLRRLTTKFPQAQLLLDKYKGYRVDKGLDKPNKKYIGEVGSGGYGMTKEKQGYDPSKPNYVPLMDPRQKGKQDFAAFWGKPRDLKFDKAKLLETTNLQKATDEYFKNSAKWKDLEYKEQEAKTNEFLKKYGLTQDSFFKGVLSKYDTDHTKKIKGMKEEARAKNKKLFEEYGKQPKGTRNLWATEKMAELVKSGYFGDNPFLNGFDWVSSESVAKAAKQKLVQQALKTGDWSAYRAKYGSKLSAKAIAYREAKKSGNWAAYGKAYGIKTSEKAAAYRSAKASGDWTTYNKKYGKYAGKAKSSPYQYKGKYFKSAGSMEKYKEGEFWRKYISADKGERRDLIAKNKKYNRRANWTNEQWDAWKKKTRAEEKSRLLANKKIGGRYTKHLSDNVRNATRYKSAQSGSGYRKKIAYA